MDGWHGLNKSGDSWRWRVSHLVWGAFTIFMMGWAFLLGLLVGQGSLGTPEQVASLKGLTSAVPGLQGLVPAEAPVEEAPAPVEERLQQPQLTFYDKVERNQPVQVKAAAPAPVKPAAPAVSTTSTPAEQGFTSAALAPVTALAGATPVPAPAPPVRTGPSVLGKLEPFRPKTAPSVTLTPPLAKPASLLPHQPGQLQPFFSAPTPRPAALGPAATTPAARPSQPAGQTQTQRRGRLIVQVATFQEEGGARDLVNRLRAAGHPAFLQRSELAGVGPSYRVRVGPYEDIDLAQGAAGRICIQYSFPAFVTREDQP